MKINTKKLLVFFIITAISFAIIGCNKNEEISSNEKYEKKISLYKKKNAEIKKDFENATVVLNWSLRSLNNNSKVYLVYRQKPISNNENDKWTEIPIENVDNLNYTKEVTLSLKNDYEFKVLVKDDKTSTSEKLLDINFYSKMKNRVQIDLSPKSKSQSNNHVKFKFSGMIINPHNLPFKHDGSGNDLLKLKNVILKIYSNGELKKEFQILKNGEIVDTDTKFGPFDHGEPNLESLEFDKTVDYDTTGKTSEVIEIIVEDYSGSTYSNKSHVF